MTDINAEFEALGALYYARYRCLRPGKDEPFASGRDSMDADNVRQFGDWIRHEALTDAVRRIIEKDAEIEHLRAALARIRDSGNGVHPLGAALIHIAAQALPAQPSGSRTSTPQSP